MSFLNRVWVAATVAVVNGNADQSHKLKSGLRSFQHGKKRFTSSTSSGVDPADLRPFAGSDVEGFLVKGGGGDDCHRRKKHADESLRQVMYLNCWGPS